MIVLFLIKNLSWVWQLFGNSLIIISVYNSQKYVGLYFNHSFRQLAVLLLSTVVLLIIRINKENYPFKQYYTVAIYVLIGTIVSNAMNIE